MGFKLEPRVYKLVFDDPELGGLEVRAASVSIGEFMEITGLDETTVLGGVTLPDGMPVRVGLLTRFAGVLSDWNLTGPKDEPLPATLETLKTQDVYLVRSIVKAWLEAVSGVTPPLPSASGSGETSAEASLELASSSQSLTN